MRIVIAGDYPDDTTAIRTGTQAAIYQTISGLLDYEDLDLSVITCEPGRRATQFGQFKARHTHYGRAYSSFHLPAAVRLPRSIATFSADRWRVRNAIQKIKPDVVHVYGQMTPYAWAAYDTGYPVVVTVDTLGSKFGATNLAGMGFGRMTRQWAWDQLEMTSLQHAKDLILSHPALEESLRPFIQRGQLTGRLHSIENPVNERLFEIKRENVEPRSILYIGSLEPRKGVLDLIEAWNHLHVWGIHCQLRMVTTQTALNSQHGKNLQARIKGLGWDHFVDWLTDCDEDEVATELAHCGVVCVPTRDGTTGIVIAEAMAAGVPVVATKTASARQMIDETQSGYCVTSGENIRLAEALFKVVGRPDRAEKIGQQARESAQERFVPPLAAQLTRDVYYDAVRHWLKTNRRFPSEENKRRPKN